MFTAENFIAAESLEQAYQLNQNKNHCILGGMLWLKMSKKKIQTLIDLSGLGLQEIEETESDFRIGCMCTLRQLELHERLNHFFDGIIKESVCHIVGVQFRNLATVGGSVYSRFGFSDVLTCLLALNSYVETYPGGILPLEEYINQKPDNSILVRIIIKKEARKAVYFTHRMTETDFPVLACAISCFEGKWNLVLGARPGKAMRISNNLKEIPKQEEVESLLKQIKQEIPFGSNLRGGEAFRRHLAGVFLQRGIERITGGANADKAKN